MIPEEVYGRTTSEIMLEFNINFPTTKKYIELLNREGLIKPSAEIRNGEQVYIASNKVLTMLGLEDDGS